ncbi:MAG: AAA family ATPase [Nakamurella sp.]
MSGQTGAVGSATTTPVVLRGNSGSGKSSVAAALRLTDPPMALVGQDQLWRVVLMGRERRELTDAVDLIALTVRFCLDRGRDVMLDGIFNAATHGAMLRQLIADHRGRSLVYYLDVPFVETVARHATRPQRDKFTVEQMREWYTPADTLGVPGETVIAVESTFQQTLARIRGELG